MSASKDRSAAGFVSVASVVAVSLGTAVAVHMLSLVGIALAIVGAVAFAATAQPVLLVVTFAVAALVEPTSWPPLVGLGGVTVYLGDLLLLLATLTALLYRGRSAPANTRRILALLLALLLLWVTVRSSIEGSVAFARVAAPVAAALALTLALPAEFDVLRPVRWVILVGYATIPLLGSTSGRWSSLAGGPNETALVAASGLVIAARVRSPLLGAASLAVLAGTRSISGATAALVGLLVLTLASRGSALHKTGRLVVVGWLMVFAIAVLPLLRPDVGVTIAAHTYQANQLREVLASGDLLLGTGWANIDEALFRSDILGLHNVYLDVLAFSGVIGLTLFISLLVVAWRRSTPPGRALLAVWAVWINTTGAFPGAAWGVLGLVLAACVLGRAPIEDRATSRVRPPTAPAVRVARVCGRRDLSFLSQTRGAVQATAPELGGRSRAAT